MLRRFVSAAAVLFVLGGFVAAETFRGLVTKIDKDSITISARAKGKEAVEKTFKITKETKFTKQARRGKAEEGKAEDVKEKSFVTVEEKDGTATEIKYGGRGRGKGKGKDKDK